MKSKTLTKYGKLIQFSPFFMEDFNDDANLFLAVYNQNLQEIKENGSSFSWYIWLEQNQPLIDRLYDALEAAGKIPTGPE